VHSTPLFWRGRRLISSSAKQAQAPDEVVNTLQSLIDKEL
jgi:hypothetical protein